MSGKPAGDGKLSRRAFGLTCAAGAGSAGLAQQVLAQQAVSGTGTPDDSPFQKIGSFTRKGARLKVQAFATGRVRLLDGPFLQAQQANLGYLKRLDADRLLHNFRVNAGLPSSAEPLGGWEKPDCELRGHFVGHYLSACALMSASTNDSELHAKGDYLVAELAKCQEKLGGGYLSAFPIELFDRLNARQKVWAPFYTIHKIMAGMLDMNQLCGNAQALQVVTGMARWTDQWSAELSEAHMQDVLNTEYGGMNDILYKLADVTNDDNYARVGDRFTKKIFFDPLALRKDELRGLHVNTHIPQVIGAAKRYEISSDVRFHDVADFFWNEVTSARCYVTGGTSNGESWRVAPRRLAEELKKGSDTTECCCAYNMLKLTRHLYTWTADPRYFDYYERTLYNHRLAALDPHTGATQYYLSILPAAWKTYNTENDSFWCCTGTGVEEFSKLTDSIYFHDYDGIYVNLFVPSTVEWKEKGVTLRQETAFPNSDLVAFSVHTDRLVRMPLRIRIPYWIASPVTVKVNDEPVEVSASSGSYLVISRTWKSGDRVELKLPMGLHEETMPDDVSVHAFLYGPLVLAGDLGTSGLSKNLEIGPLGPDVKAHPLDVPTFRTASDGLASWIQPLAQPLTFRTAHQPRDVTFQPLSSLSGKRYSIYWTVS